MRASKVMKNKPSLLVLCLMMISMVFVSGCTTETEYSEYLKTEHPPTNIDFFTSTEEGKFIMFRFLLEDADGYNTIGDGHVEVEISDKMNNTLYLEEFDVKASEFVDEVEKAYEWRVPKSEIKKSVFSYGTGILTFTTPSGKQFKAIDDSISVPQYTEEELTKLNEQKYLENAIEINKKQRKGSFEITVVRVGFFSPITEYGERKEYFRVDLEVKNIGVEPGYWCSGFVILDKKGNQYDKEYYSGEGELDTGKIYEGVTKKGFMLFETLPKTTTSAEFRVEGGYDDDYNKIVYRFDLPLT